MSVHKLNRIRRYAAAEAWACKSDDGPRLLLEGDEGARSWLERVAAAHAAIDTRHVARVVATHLDGSKPSIVFDCSATVDLDLIVDAAAQSDIKMEFPAAIAFNEVLLDTLEAAHRGSPPQCVGALGWRNILIGPDGDMWLFGFGENFAARHPERGFSNVGSLSAAPEIAFGAAPTPSADVYAAFTLIQSLFPHVDIYPAFADAAAGTEGASLRDALVALSADILARSAEDRIGDIATLRGRYRAIRALDGRMPSADPATMARFWADLVAAASGDLPAPSARPAAAIVVDRTKRAVQIGDTAPITLARRKSLWRLLDRLVEAHVDDLGPQSVDDLQNAGWPDERILPEAGRARVYVGISTLRRLGLGDVIVRNDNGYHLAESVQLRVAT